MHFKNPRVSAVNRIATRTFRDKKKNNNNNAKIIIIIIIIIIIVIIIVIIIIIIVFVGEVKYFLKKAPHKEIR